jgi:hypothetical protein
MMIDVIGVRRLAGYSFEIAFSNDMIGERDFSFILREFGPILEPLNDPGYFARVFVDDGALIWPNGYDWDPIALHDDMKTAGLLRRVDAAE